MEEYSDSDWELASERRNGRDFREVLHPGESPFHRRASDYSGGGGGESQRRDQIMKRLEMVEDEGKSPLKGILVARERDQETGGMDSPMIMEENNSELRRDRIRMFSNVRDHILRQSYDKTDDTLSSSSDLERQGSGETKKVGANDTNDT